MSTIERCSQRQQQPWTRVTKPYLFHTPQGLQSLADLFDGRTHLIVQHFALAAWKGRRAGRCFGPDVAEHLLACPADDDVVSVAVSRAPLAEIEAVKRRMGWRFRWVSSNGSDFNYDYHVTFHSDENANERQNRNGSERALSESDGCEVPGTSTFCKDAEGEVFHTSSERLTRF
jgi:predicted dithiol-disulfide oxidoreductase (DUF899 family)